MTEFVAHYRDEPNHQGLGNELIVGAPTTGTVGCIRRRRRLGGLLNYYDRAPWLFAPVIAPLLLMVFWLIRVRFVRRWS